MQAAKKLLEAELFADAVSRAYYACLHGVKAALLIEGVKVSSHRAVLNLFGQHLVKTGKIEKEYGKVLREEQEDREVCDYDVFQVVESDRACPTKQGFQFVAADGGDGHVSRMGAGLAGTALSKRATWSRRTRWRGFDRRNRRFLETGNSGAGGAVDKQLSKSLPRFYPAGYRRKDGLARILERKNACQ